MLGRLALAFVCAAVLAVGWSVSPPVRAADDVCPAGRDNNPQNRPDGSLIRDPVTGAIYRVEGCAKRPFRTWEEFDSHRYDGWVSAPNVSPEELAKLPTIVFAGAREGALFRNNTAGDPNYGTIYIIDETGPGTYTKRPITGATWNLFFVPCSYVTPPNVSASWLASNYPNTGPTVNHVTTLRPDGQVVKASSSATDVFIVAGNGQKQRFSNTSDRNSYNFPQQPCIDGAIASPTAYPYGVPSTIRAREGTAVQSGSPIYIVDFLGGWYDLRNVTSMDSLTFYTRVADVKSGWSTSGYGIGPHVHPYKSLFADRWHKNLTAQSLVLDRLVAPGSNPNWAALVTQGRDYWNATATTVTIDEAASYDPANDIHVVVQAYLNRIEGGWVDFKDANGNFCPGGDCAGGATYRSTDVYLNDRYAPGQGVTTHELGHALTLAHDGLNPDNNGDGLPDMDGKCGLASIPIRVPTTIMDYDCYVSFGIVSPQPWDVCGINHAYPSNNGSAGC